MPNAGYVVAMGHTAASTLTAVTFISPQGPYRKSLAIKHLDGEPLTRQDIQYDVLYYLFSNTETVFTDPYPTIQGGPAGSKVTFRDLYVNALVHSAKCSKVTKDKLLDTPEFGVEFSKISLLSNVGRINTTMACKTVHNHPPLDVLTFATRVCSLPRDAYGAKDLPSGPILAKD